MFNHEAMYLPCNSPNWNYVTKYITDVNINYDKLNTISDVIKILREIRLLFDGSYNLELNQDFFLGIGLFLEKFSKDELNFFIKNNFRNLLQYMKMVESLTENNLLKFSQMSNTVRLSFATIKSLLACSVVFLIPHTFNNSVDGSCDQFVNINFQDLYNGVHFGSNSHIKLVQNILEYFSVYTKESFAKELETFIVISLNKTQLNPPIFHETITSWPIIFTTNSSNIPANIRTVENIWPINFNDINPLNYFNNLQFKSDRSLGSVCPFLVFILPLLTLGFPDFSTANVIDVSFDGTHHTIYRILPLDHWDSEPQYFSEYISTNIISCVQAFDCLTRKYQSTNSLFANNLTNSVIEDAINKLNLNSSSQSTNIILDSTKTERVSLSNIFFNSRKQRETSISSNSSNSRSARQSYSTSSSSRSGSVQLSTLSSRRSSNNSTNKDIDCCNANIVDKSDFTSYGFHPIILEESNIQADDDECLLLPHGNYQELLLVSDCSQNEIQFDKIMSAPISDSTKLSLSKDYFQTVGQRSSQCYTSKRRNSSPILGFFISNESLKNPSEIRKPQMKQTQRCCEEDATNNRLASYLWSRSNNHGRRQSLPCHLQWVYQLPLTDSIKLNLSHSQNLSNDFHNNSISNEKSVISDWSSNFVDTKILAESGTVLKNLVNLANNILDSIIPDLSRRKYQSELTNQILNYKMEIALQSSTKQQNTNKNESVTEESLFPIQKDFLQTKDLASFDKELFSFNFSDDEALQFFSQFSDYKSSKIDFPECEFEITVCNQNKNSKDIRCKEDRNDSLMDYASHLTLTIIDDALISETNAQRQLSSKSFNEFADNISVDIIANSLAELASKAKSESILIQPIYVGPFSTVYNQPMSMVMQILSASVSQFKNKTGLILVCDNTGNSEFPEIIEFINQNKDHITPSKVYDALTDYCNSERFKSKINFKDFLLKSLTK